MNLSSFAERVGTLTPERVLRSLKVRTMRAVGRLGPVRAAASFGYTGRAQVQSQLFPNLDPAAVTQSVRRDGICTGLRLPDATLKELLAFAHDTPCFGDKNPSVGYVPKDHRRAEAAAGQRFTVGGYFNTYDGCPAIREIANDPVVREIALRYVGPRAKHLGTCMWWSYAGDLGHEQRNTWAQLFHYDLDDYKFIKFFFYLTEVDLGSGPHVYVRGTHRQKTWGHTYPMRRLGDDEVISTYGSDRVLTLQGSAGEGFVEDTFGLHKGQAPDKRDRLILQFEYALSQGYTDDRCDPASMKLLPL